MDYYKSEHSDCSKQSSALSPRVKKLLCEIGTGVPNDDSCTLVQNGMQIGQKGFSFLATNGLLNIDECMNQCLQITQELPWTSEDYIKAAYHVSQIFEECQYFLESKEHGEFSDIYREHFEWTKNGKLFMDAFELLSSNQGDKDVLALLLVCGGIEHALGNVYLLKGHQCPTLLKDLLSTEELKGILGETIIKLLHILIGPPISMNLRNVAWHGFFSVGELPRRYVYFLLVLTASLSQSLLSKGFNVSCFTGRPYYSLCKADIIVDKFSGLDEHSLEKMEQCIVNSWFSGKANKIFIKGIFKLYRERKYGFSSALALTVLESILRKLFVSVNNCPERLLTAEATTLYTTFEENQMFLWKLSIDEICEADHYSKILNYCLPDGKENNLILILGEPFLDVLHDLLIYPNGPRARDKLGHGEADYYCVPQSLPSVVIACMAFIAIKPQNTEKNDTGILNDLLVSVEGYESVFHPLTMLKWKIIELSQTASSLHEDLNTSPDLSSCDRKTGLHEFVEENSSFKEISHHMITFLDSVQKSMTYLLDIDELRRRFVQPFSNINDFAVKALTNSHISTLHRWQGSTKPSSSDITESEIVNLLLRTIGEASISLKQSQGTLLQRQEQLDNKSLRSRQRENFRKLLCFLPTLNVMMNYVTVLSLYIFNHLECHSQSDCKNLKLLQRFLKNNLQVTENLRTFTANDKNKWTQSEEIIVKAVLSGVTFIKQWQTDS